VKCASCGYKIGKNDDSYVADEGTQYSGKPVCESCYEYDLSEPAVTVYYGKSDEPKIVGTVVNETDSDFRAYFKHTDPWRGYFQTEPDKYALVNTAELLAYHESEEMLARFDKRIRQLFDENDIDYARVFARSSNVFFQNYDLYVRKESYLPALLLVEQAKRECDYDNPKHYQNIVFDDEALGTLAKLFPEEKISTDYDAVKVVEKYGDDMIPELKRRLTDKGS
jgi:hypothetical protein